MLLKDVSENIDILDKLLPLLTKYNFIKANTHIDY